MALTATQRLLVKKHLNVWPHDTLVDASIEALEDGAEKEGELTTALSLCNTTLTNLQTAQTASDELVEGGGARFSYERYISIRRAAYRDAQLDLARLLGVDLDDQFGGTVATGWRVN